MFGGLAPLATLFMMGHGVPPLHFPTQLAPFKHQDGVYVDGVPQEVFRFLRHPTRFST